MNTFNYRGLTFAEHKGEDFHILTLTFLDYNGDFREITITWQSVGRKSLWLAQFSGLTTEYSGNLTTVLKAVAKHYEQHSAEFHDPASGATEEKGKL